MAKRNIRIIKEYTEKHKKRSTRQRVLIGIAALVVFCTTYAMILPAITMEGKLKCQKEEHIHQGACYGSEKTLTCQQKEGEIHLHQENCYTPSGELVCNISTTEVHTHTEECYTSKMIMVCKKIPHQHYQECFNEVATEKQEVAVVPEEKPTEALTEVPSIEVATEITSEITTDPNAKDKIPSEVAKSEDASGYTDLADYLKKLKPQPGSGPSSITHAFYINNKLIEEDDLSLLTGEGFQVRITITAPDGILSGKYKYTLPAGIYLADDAEHSGDVVSSDSNKKNVGTFSTLEDTNVVILLTFNSEMENYQGFVGHLKFDIGIDNGGEEPQPAKVEKLGNHINSDGSVDVFNNIDGMFHFKINANIPAYRGSKTLNSWYIQDHSMILDGFYPMYSWDQELTDVTIKVSYYEDGEIVNKPIQEISTVKDDTNVEIAYKYNPNKRRLHLLNRCKCISANCKHWKNDGCNSLKIHFDNKVKEEYKGWCTCWHFTKNLTLTIEYKNNQLPDSSYILNNYPGFRYVNSVLLTSEADKTTTLSADVSEDIPKLVTKELDEDFEFSNETNYRGLYRITINESQVDLSKVDADNDGNADDKLLIQDNITNATYIPGTFKIEAIDEDGVPQDMIYGEDYEFEYVLGSDIESEIYKATMNIYLKKLGPYTYNVEYKAQAISSEDEGVEADLNVSNTVSAGFYSFPTSTNTFTSSFEQGWSYLRRFLTLRKIEKVTPPDSTTTIEPTNPEDLILLPGATYGLFTAEGYKIAEGTTNEKGEFTFATNVRLGIIFNEETPYYVRELVAPDGYNLDSKQHWFCFTGDSITEEYFEEAYKVELDGIMFCSLDEETAPENNIMTLEDEKTIFLPETGGCGKFIYMAAGLLLIFCGVYGLYKKFLFERRVY